MSADKWEQFAQKNAEYYIDTADHTSPESFFRSGQLFIEKTLEDVLSKLPDVHRALEIGCGVGRLTFPHAREFREVIAVDIAPTMLKKLRQNAKQFEIHNVRPFLMSEDWDGKAVDYAYSYLVFQHIEELEVIHCYIKRIATCLKPGGYAQLQFDTRPAHLGYKIRNKLPDAILSRNQRRGIRRTRREPGKLEALFKKYDLDIVGQKVPGTAMHTFLLKS